MPRRLAPRRAVAVAPVVAAAAVSASAHRVTRHGSIPVAVPVGHHKVQPLGPLDLELAVSRRVSRGSLPELYPGDGGPRPPVFGEVDEGLLPPRGVP